MLERKDDDVKRNIDNYESSIKLLEQQLNRATLDVETLREKGLKYDELYRDFVKLEKEKIILENKVSFFAGTPVDTRNDVPMNENDLRVKYSILCTDKEYLTRENLRQTEIIKKLEEKVRQNVYKIMLIKLLARLKNKSLRLQNIRKLLKIICNLCYQQNLQCSTLMRSKLMTNSTS